MAGRSENLEAELFYRALNIDLAGRGAFLKERCGEDQELYRRVQALLQAYESDDCSHHISRGNSQTTLSRPSHIEGPGTVIGRYKLLEKIGEGGFGVVWAAMQKNPVKRRVALKIIKLGMDTKQVIARFEAERQALALMDHANIAKVLDGGATEAGRPYFVMELVRGIPIIAYCDQEKLSTQDRLDLFVKVCHAIQHAHQKGIIHRDIKPSNILVTLHDGVPVPRVIDFGIAKATQQELTEKTLFTLHHQFIGTPVYMSPEQAEMSSLDIDTRSDIYSLGVLLYELLTGSTPFEEKELLHAGIDAMRRIIREQEPPRPSTKFATLQMKDRSTTATRHGTDSPRLISLLRGDLDWIVMKCLEKSRTRRYDTAGSLARDVSRHLNSEPITARPPTTLYQLQKAWRRNRVVFTAAAAVVLALLLGTGISAWQAWVANSARMQSDADREMALQEGRKAKEGERKQRLIAYASDMKVAQGALREDNLSRAKRLLSRYVPKPGREDLRGIEWRYLWQASRGDEIHTFHHESMVSSVSLSADGTRLASSSINGDIRLFDVESQKPLPVPEHDGERWLGWIQRGLVALSPDGHLLAALGQGTLTVRNANNGELVSKYGQVAAPICFSPDSGSLAGMTEAGVRIWNTGDWTSRVVGEPLAIGLHQSRSLVFTSDGSRLIICPTHLGGKIKVWSITDNRLEEGLPGLGSPCSISTQGSMVAAGGWEGEVCVWDLTRRKVIKRIQTHNNILLGVALSPDGKTLATGGHDQVIRLWDTARDFANTRTLKGHLGEIWDLKFSGDSRFLASASKDRTVKLWDLKPPADAESEHSVRGDLFSRGFSGAGDELRFHDPCEWSGFTKPGGPRPGHHALPRSRTDHILNLRTGQWRYRSRSDSEAIAGATSKTWESGQDIELFGKEDGTVVLSDGATTRSITVAKHPVQPLLLSAKGRYLLVNVLPEKAEHAILWDVEAEGVVGRFPMIKKYRRRTRLKQAISPDERFLAYNGDNYSVELWHIPERRKWATLRGHTWHLFGVEFSPDSRLLASSSWDSDCRLWDVEKGTQATPHRLQGHRNLVGRASFSPDGRTVATSSWDLSCKLWSVATGQEMLSLPAPQATPLIHFLPMMAAQADRIVWGGYSETQRSLGSAEDVLLRVTTLPSLAEIDEEIRRKARNEAPSKSEEEHALKAK